MAEQRDVHEAVARLRENYQHAVLTEEDAAADPWVQFERWLSEALRADLREPNAMTVATATPDGTPSARIVLLRSFDAQGFVFYTNYESRKGQELSANPRAAVVFYWAELERQVRAVGTVSRVLSEESDTYFHSRPVGSQLGAIASAQSKVIEGRTGLEARWHQLEQEFAGREVPRPPYWGGYRIAPTEIEFWQGRSSRLHDRLAYTRGANGWQRARLSP